MAARRLQTELKSWGMNPPEGCVLEEDSSELMKWVVIMQGPDSSIGIPSLYEGDLFRLQFKFNDRYPLEPPEVIFIPPAPIHPHIYSNGHICLNILYDGANGGWSPALTVSKICLSLRSMLASNTDKSRPPGDEDYCARVGGKSPKETSWAFHDDTV